MGCTPQQRKTAKNLIRRVFTPQRAAQIARNNFKDKKELAEVLRAIGADDDAVTGVLKYVSRGHRVSVKMGDAQDSKAFSEDLYKDEAGPKGWIKEADGTFTAPDMELFKTGVWNGSKITREILASIVESTNKIHDKLKPYIKLGHKEAEFLRESMPSFGWIGKLRLAGDSMRASVTKIPAVLAKAVRLERYKRGSVEIVGNYKEPDSGERFPVVLRAFAFLGADSPAVSSLADIANFESVGLEVKRYDFNLQAPDTVGEKPQDQDKKEVKKNMAEIDEKELQTLKDKAARADAAESTAKESKEQLVKTFAQMKARKIDAAWSEILKSGRAKPAQKDGFERVAKTLDDTNVQTFSDGEGKERNATALDDYIADWKARPVVEEFKQKSGEHRDE